MRGRVTYASLSSVLDDYRAGDWRADIALVTGDLVQDDSAAAYANFADIMGVLGIPVYCLPGNHDVHGLMQDALGEPPFHYCETVTTPAWTIISVDSCIPGEVGGRVSAAELDRIDAEISRSDAEFAMVCLHHPPVLVKSAWLDAHGLKNSAELLQRLAVSGKVRLVVFGHVHQHYDASHDGIRIIGTPSTCRQFKPLSDEFATDDRPPAYRRIELLDDGNVAQELVWLTT